MRDTGSFDDFFAAWGPRLTRNIYLSTGDLTRAEDCVQEAFMRAWLRWDQLDGKDDPVGWVRNVAWRLAINDWRNGLRRVKTMVRRGVDPDLEEPSADVIVIHDALQKLTTHQRTAVVLHYYEDLPVRQIAELTGVNEGTVKSRLSRGRHAMAGLLTGEPEPREERERT